MFERSLPSANRLAIALLAVCGLVVGTAGVAAQDASVEFDRTDGQVVVRNATDATIAGTADLEPGANLTLRVQSAGDTQPAFLKTRTVTVGDDGGFEAAFDFSQQSPGDSFEVVARHDGETVAAADGVVLAPGQSPSALGGTETATETTPDETGAATPGFGVVAAVLAVGIVAAVGRFG